MLAFGGYKFLCFGVVSFRSGVVFLTFGGYKSLSLGVVFSTFGGVKSLRSGVINAYV